MSSIVVDFITPESDTSMWYFWGMARNFRPEDKGLTAQIRDGQGKIFGEDLQVLELQQRNLLQWPGRELLKLKAGDVIPIDFPEAVTLRAEDVPVFRGKFGVSQGNRAIKISSRVQLKPIGSVTATSLQPKSQAGR